MEITLLVSPVGLYRDTYNVQILPEMGGFLVKKLCNGGTTTKKIKREHDH